MENHGSSGAPLTIITISNNRGFSYKFHATATFDSLHYSIKIRVDARRVGQHAVEVEPHVHVDAVICAQAVIGDPQQPVRIGREIHPHDIRLLAQWRAWHVPNRGWTPAPTREPSSVRAGRFGREDPAGRMSLRATVAALIDRSCADRDSPKPGERAWGDGCLAPTARGGEMNAGAPHQRRRAVECSARRSANLNRDKKSGGGSV